MSTKPIRTLAAGWVECQVKLPQGDLAPISAADAIELCRSFYYYGAGETMSILFDELDDMDEQEFADLANSLLKEVHDMLEERQKELVRRIMRDARPNRPRK